MNDSRRPREGPRTPDEKMSREEKEDLEDQIENFEGPDRREDRGDRKKSVRDPGVAHS